MDADGTPQSNPHRFRGRVSFAVGTGRCGTHFIAELLSKEPSVHAVHERAPMRDAFWRYATWYGLPVDPEGVLRSREREICDDLSEHAHSFEASAYLSLNLLDLHRRFDARFVVLVRDPAEVVNSFWTKGWYPSPYVQSDSGLALGHQDTPRPHHTFARLAPRGDAFGRWNGLTRVGKIAWFWNAINLALLDQLRRLPPTHGRLVRLEAFTYRTYLDLAGWLGVGPTVSEAAFDALATSRPGRRERRYATAAWSAEEAREFEREVRPAAQALGYPSAVHPTEREA